MAKTLTPKEDDGHAAWRALVASIDGGKLVGGARYLHLSALSLHD